MQDIELFKTHVSFINKDTDQIETYEVCKDCKDGTYWICNKKNWLRMSKEFINENRTDNKEQK